MTEIDADTTEDVENEEDVKEKVVDKEDEEEEEFKVLGDKKTGKRRKVARKLPDWIRDGVCIENADVNSATSLETASFLEEDVKTALREIDGFDSLLPVQMHVIPAIIDTAVPQIMPPADICCAAPTGSGKTLAYLLPVLQLLRRRLLRSTLGAIVMVPTRGLATQLITIAAQYGTKLGVKVAEVNSNGTCDDDVAMLICTPGRFSSALPHLNLAHLRYLVLDECDRLLTDDRHGWLQQLMATVAEHSSGAGVARLSLGKLWSVTELTSPILPLQRLLFSATFTANPTWLEPLCLVNPRLFSVELPSKKRPYLVAKKDNEDAPAGAPLPHNLSEFMVLCPSNSMKPLSLITLLSDSLSGGISVPKPALVFTNSSRNATRLTLLLNAADESQKLRTAGFSGRFTPKRLRKLSKQILEKKLDIIVCTDAAARGFDCPELASVVSYDLPLHPRTYIHRAGRTARAGRHGSFFSLVAPPDRRHWQKLIAGAERAKNVQKMTLSKGQLAEYQQAFEKALQSTASKIKSRGKAKKINREHCVDTKMIPVR